MAEESQDEFNRLLKQLDLDRDMAWERYQTVWRKLVKFFECRNCFPAEDLADETLARIARRNDLAEIRSLEAFAHGIAQRISLEHWAKMKKETYINDLPGGAVAAPQNVETETLERVERERRLRCVQQCLQNLPANERALFLDFQGAGRETHIRERKKLAAQIGISLAALRTRVCRLRLELERCAKKCLSQYKVKRVAMG